MTLKINKDLNLVVELVREDGSEVLVHCAPLPEEVFRRYFMTIAKAFAAIYSEGLALIAGPRIAGLILEKIGREIGDWDARPGGDPGLLAHMRRLSAVIVPDGHGWKSVPMHDAVALGMLDEEDVSEVEGVIAFFICAHAMHHRSVRGKILELAAQRWSGQVTCLNATEYLRSLPTSIAGANSGAKAVSSVPR